MADIKGQRTLISTILSRAQDEPERIYGSFPLTDNVEDGFRDFTVGEFVQAIDVCAWSIEKTFGRGEDYETLLYLGVSDFRYAILFFAAIKCGYKACFQNFKSPPQDNVAILEMTGCVKAFFSTELEETIQEYKTRRPELQICAISSLIHFFEADAQHFPYQPKPWEEAKHEPILVLHSSGTTGAPKPIILRNGALKVLDHPWSSDAGQMKLWDNMNGSFVYGPLPSFHLGGFYSQIVMPTLSRYSASVVAPASSNFGADADLAIKILKSKNVQMVSCSPRLLKYMAETEQGIEILAGLQYLTFGGAPLPQHLGDKLSSRGVRMCPIYGTTECGWLPTLPQEDTEDWAYLNFHPDQNIIFENAGHGDGTHELCFQDAGAEHNELRATHWTLQTDSWRSKDLFVQHPSKPGFWKYTGRTDDLLVLAHADKINPVPLEDIVQSHSLVSGALMAGEARWPSCMFIEPLERVDDVEAFKQDIWPTIEKANLLVFKDSRVPYSHVVVVEANSLQRNLKGGIVRVKNISRLADTMEDLYDRQ